MNEKGGEVGDALKAAGTASPYLMSSTILSYVVYLETHNINALLSFIHS